MSTDALDFVITGGTLDSIFDPVKETTLPSERSYIPTFVKMLQLYEDITFTELFMKDSRSITGADRKILLAAVEKSSAKRIIVTHGSYTVSASARYIKKNLTTLDKVVIFVCSLVPLVGITPTDAGFNLGYAVAKSQTLSAGVYVCMNGRVFDAEEVDKILETGRFKSTYTK